MKPHNAGSITQQPYYDIAPSLKSLSKERSKQENTCLLWSSTKDVKYFSTEIVNITKC